MASLSLNHSNGKYETVLSSNSGLIYGWREELSVLYPRLFTLEQDKGWSIKDRIASINQSISFTWNWRRSRRGQESGQFSSLRTILLSVFLQPQSPDSWTTTFARNGIFSVKEVAGQLDLKWATPSPSNNSPQVSTQKIIIFLWRARQNFLQCYLNLGTRVINISSITCPLCSVEIKGIEHSLLFCPKAFMVWKSVAQWCGNPVMLLWEVFDLSSQETLNLAPAGGETIW